MIFELLTAGTSVFDPKGLQTRSNRQSLCRARAVQQEHVGNTEWSTDQAVEGKEGNFLHKAAHLVGEA